MKDTRVGLSGEIDTYIPNVARIYDYLLGGAHNFASDRSLASTIERIMRGIRDVVRLNRSFLRRAVSYMIDAGVRNVHEIAAEPEGIAVHARTLLDFAEPIGLLARYREPLAPGSFLAITHLTGDANPEGYERSVDEVRRRGTDEPMPRTHEQVVGMFDGFELVEPGVVGCAEWHPGGPGDFSEETEANELFMPASAEKGNSP